jgi:zinc protease
MKKRTIALFIFMLLVPTVLYFSIHKNAAVNTTSLKQMHIGLVKKTSLNIIQWISDNGARVYFVPNASVPMVDIQIDFNAGSARDESLPGLANFCAQLLDQGSDELDANAIAMQFEDVGAVYSVQAQKDRLMISLRSLSDAKQLNPSVNLLARLLSHPSFSETAIANIRNQLLIGLKKSLQQPNVLANFAFFKAIYQDHPYAHPVIGTTESITAIQQNALLAFHQQYFVGNNANITIVGNLSQAEAKSLVDTLMQSLPKGTKAPLLPAVASLTQTSIEHIPFQSEQTHVMLGQPCATSHDPDYFPLTLGNYILGGNPLNSRLYQEIRKKRGLVYSVGSALLTLKQPAPFMMRLQTKNEHAKEAINVTEETLAFFIKEGPTDAEVSEAKNGLTRALPLEISSNEKITDFVSTLAFYELPSDFLSTYDHHLKAVSAFEIQSVFQKRIDPTKMVLVTVGPDAP